ncbi:MAG: CbiQ family ECF transporter T component, partial [Marinilabilia sp.]
SGFVSKIKLSRISKMYKFPLFFILTGCITIAVSFGSADPLISLNIGGLGIDKANALLARDIFFRGLAVLSLIYFYLLTHTISEISETMYKSKFPNLLVELFVLSYKFIHNLWSTSKTMLIAQNCRLAYSHRRNRIYAFSLLLSAVFRKALNQTSQLEVAINSRLGDGHFYFLNPQRGFHKAQIIAPLLLSVCLTGLFLIFENYG